MASGLIYAPQLTPDGLSRPIDPGTTGGELTGQAMGRLGQTIERTGDHVFAAMERARSIRAATDVERRTTNFLADIDGLNQKFQNDPDPSTAADRYREELDQARKTRLDGADPMVREHLDNALARKAITATSNARFDQLKRQGDQYVGDLDHQYQVLTRQYANAKTDAERQAATADLETTLQRGISSGMATHKMAEGYRQSLTKTGDEAQALRAIGANPAAARAQLADPTQLMGLDPVRRQQLADHARAAEDEARSAGIIQQARFNPAAAALNAGRLTDPKQAELIFDAAIIPQESGGRPGAVSVQGALGLSQIMPDTARDMARKLGKSEIAGLDNTALKERLTSDPRLNRELGLAYFTENLRRFNGSLAATFAAYHAGGGEGGAVDTAHRKAVAAHGENYTPDQFLSFMPETLRDGSGKRTVDYVRDLYTRVGVATNQPAMSSTAGYRLSNAVGAVLDQEVARRNQLDQRLVSLASRGADELAPILKDGYAVDAARLAAVRAPLALAAVRGEASAAEKLRTLDEAVATAPMVQQMYRMRPEDLASDMATARQQMAQGVVTPELNRRVELGEKVLAEMQAARTKNPLALIERQGIVPATPVTIATDFSNPDQVAQFRQQISARSIASDRARLAYGGAQQFFRPEERDAIKARFNDMGDNDRFRLIEAVATSAATDTARDAAISELTAGNTHAATAAMILPRDPQLAKMILTGAALLNQDGVKPKIDDLRKGMEGVFGGDLYPASVQAGLMEAALAVYAAERGKNGALYNPQDRDALKAAAERVTGKVETINGRRTPVPNDIPSWQVKDALYSLDQPTLEALGGAVGANGAPLTATVVRRYAQLRPLDVGGGRYAVTMAGPGGEARPVLTAAGRPLTIDARELVAKVRLTKAPTPYQAGARERANMILREGDRVAGEVTP